MPNPSERLRSRLARSQLYLCTDARRERGDLAEFADAALAGGVDIIQLRDKGSPGEQQYGPLEARQELEALAALADAARRHDALLAVNDRADIALAAGADVLHLGQDDLPLAIARDIIGPNPLIGRSTHDGTQVAAAIAAPAPDGPDYFCVGPCWPTPTKPGRPAPGLDLVRATAANRNGKAMVRDRRDRRGTAARGGRGRCASCRGGARDHRGRRSARGGATVEGRAQSAGLTSSGIDAVTVRSRSQLAAKPGCSGRSATSSSATQRSSALSRLGVVSQQPGRVGDDGRVGPARAAAAGDLGGDDGRAHGELVGGQPRFLVRLADGGLFDGFVAVPGAAGQTPRSALMTPRRPMLQQHGGRTVGAWRPQQQTGRTVPTPEGRAGVGHDPAVTVATHALRIRTRVLR